MNNEETISSFDFSILCEDASNEDLFEDQTHQRISENLHSLIDKSPKGITIGLEGSWGSGKSTVINLLKEKLDSNHRDNRLFFMFDAWAHDGDPLRRIFLESLIRKIDPQEKDKELNEIKGKITGRTKTITAKAKKSTSRLGKFISFSALLIPFGTSLLNKVDYSKLVFPWLENNGPYYTFIFGLMFCLAPLMVLAYWFFYGDKDHDTKEISWEFFRVDSKEDYTQDITEDGERTSIEFEDFFSQIINTAIKNHNIEKVIIVIDNLDRVTPEHAKNVWSTLQTFFQRRSTTGTTETWPDQVWFIVPFDRYGFKKIWTSDGNDQKTSGSFLKKCFQLVAEVPHPVMSGWSQYVEKCINLSLHKWPSDEKQKVISTYIRYASRLDKSPTPRDIRIFVNQVGLLGSMWGNQTSVEAMSLYVLLRENFSTDQLRSSLINNDALGNYQPDTEQSVLLPQLAGLLFGVNSNKGLQLLLAPEIHSAFKTGDGNTLKKLSQDHNNAFWIAYEASKDLWELTMDKSDDYKFSFTTALFLGLASSQHKIKREISCLPKIWIDSYPSLNFESNDYSSVINYTFQLCGDSSFLKSIKDLTTEKITQEVSKINSEIFSVKVFRNLLPLIELLKEHQYKIESKVYPKLNCENWMLWLENINDEKISFNLVLPKKQAIIELANEVQFTYSKLDEQALDHLIQTYEIYPTSSEWEDVTNSVISWLNMYNRDVDCEKIYGFALNLATGNNDNISDKIIKCVDGSDFWYNMEDVSISKNPSLPILAAVCIHKDLQKHDYVSSAVKSYWNDSIDKNSADEIYAKLEKINYVGVLWLLSRDCNNTVAIEIVTNYVTPELYGHLNGVRFIDEFTWADEKNISEIAHNLIKHGAFIKNQSDMVDRATVYDTVYKIFYSLNDKNTSQFIDSETNKLTQEAWYEAIETNSQLTLLVKEKNPHFSDALCKFLITTIHGDTKKPRGWNFSIISDFVTKVADLEKTFLPTITEAYFSHPSDNLDTLEFNTLSPYFSSYINKINSTQIMQKINLWLDNSQWNKIEWLFSHNIIFNEPPLESLIGRVKLFIESDDKEKISIASLICDGLNIVLEKEENEFVETT